MAIVNKAYTFTNGQTADGTQVNQDLDTLYTLVNGNIDSANLKALGIATSNIAVEAVTPAKTEGIPYSTDLYGSTGFVQSGLTATKDGTALNQVNITTGIIHIVQTDGTLRRFAPAATNFRTTSASATYYLDFQPDGTWSWATGHSSQTGYVTIVTVTSDASSNVNVITDTRPLGMNPTVLPKFPLSNGQNPNLLFNPSAHLGLTGWVTSGTGTWTSNFGTNGEGGYWGISSGGSATGAYWYINSTKIPMGASKQITVSGEILTSGQTAGQAYIAVNAYDGSNAFLADILDIQATIGTGWTKYSGTITTPANTAFINVQLLISNNAATTNTGFRKIKVEPGSIGTTFSDDNTLNTQQYGSVLGFAQVLSGGYKLQSGVTSAVTVPASGTVSTPVTFPAIFSAAPSVVAVGINSMGNATSTLNSFRPTSVAAGSFTPAATVSASGSGDTVSFWWIAIGT